MTRLEEFQGNDGKQALVEFLYYCCDLIFENNGPIVPPDKIGCLAEDIPKTASLEEMSDWMCKRMEMLWEIADAQEADPHEDREFALSCDSCPAQRFCLVGHVGFMDYLLQEAGEWERTWEETR